MPREGVRKWEFAAVSWKSGQNVNLGIPFYPIASFFFLEIHCSLQGSGEGEMRRTLFVLKLAERNDRAVFPQLILKDKRLKVSPEMK